MKQKVGMIVVMSIFFFMMMFYREENMRLKEEVLLREKEIREVSLERDNLEKSYFIAAENSETYRERCELLEEEVDELKFELTRKEVKIDEYDLTWGDVSLIAEVSKLEAGETKKEGQQAVTKVIKNRLESDRFPNSVKEIIYQQGQFAVSNSLRGNVSSDIIVNCLKVIIGDYDMPDDVLFFHAYTGTDSKKDYKVIDGNVFTF